MEEWHLSLAILQNLHEGNSFQNLKFAVLKVIPRQIGHTRFPLHEKRVRFSIDKSRHFNYPEWGYLMLLRFSILNLLFLSVLSLKPPEISS